jgi:26S proteasome regulatory subunit N4
LRKVQESFSPRSFLTDFRIVRTTRARIIWLKNDYKDIMNRIEKGLHEYHASLRAAGPPKEESIDVVAGPAEERQPEPIIETPFARVNTVEPGSPAHEANLKAGDRIRTFGAANWTNHENLRKVAEVVQRNEGVRSIFTKLKTFVVSLYFTSDQYLSRS